MAMHELGHYFLRHSGINYKMMKDGSFAVDIQEFEANLFAELTTKTEAKNAQN
jgi:Zn-dependent peptidase ImmA (M78 family)